MMRKTSLGTVVLGLLALAAPAFAGGGGWVEFTNETISRLVADPAVGVSDAEEKDYAYGDVDHDGDIDLVCVRKEPFTTPGRRRNVLFMNEGIAQGHAVNGVLVDRTLQYASEADDAGQGFLDETNDRDVILADVNNDGWADMITAVTLSEGLPKTISHPRIYMNQASIAGAWQGFRYEQARTPQIVDQVSGAMGSGRFCSVAAGDVTGDGFADLYFGDYDQGPSRPFDTNDRLWINDGTGHFTDSMRTRMNETMLHSAFGMASAIADMNLDGRNDVVRDTALNDPRHVSISYNSFANPGFFDAFEAVYTVSPYHVTVGDLNNDNRPDMIISDDGSDRYLINTGNGTDGRANFSEFTFSFQTGGDNGFGGNSRIVDLNNDGLNDAIITGVDVDAPGCGREMFIYRNLGGSGNPPNVILQKQGTSVPWSPAGVFDVAVFDLNGDGWKDLILGTCTGTQVWINEPPIGLVYSYPLGLPAFVTPDADFNFQIQLTAFGGGAPVPGSAVMHLSVDGDPFVDTSLTTLGGDLYGAALPSRPCTHRYAFYFTAQLSNGGGTFTDPSGGVSLPYGAVAADGTLITLRDELEGDTSAWTVVNAPNLNSGGWEAAVPNGSVFSGSLAAPDHDATEAAGSDTAFVTGNGAIGGLAQDSDVDRGPTHLISPVINVAGTDAIISYSRWFFNNDATDSMVVSVSNNNGGSWTTVHSTAGTNGQWESAGFQVGEFVAPTSEVRVRFSVADEPNNSVTEGGIDNFQVMKFICDIDCGTGGDCQDALFCNGAEQCVGSLCQGGTPPCPGQMCDEANDRCVTCLGDVNCDDGLFCNGTEACADGACQSGGVPCGNPGLSCDESANSCIGCTGSGMCNDGSYCNGAESCFTGTCLPAFAGAGNGTFDGQSGWTNHIQFDAAITYGGRLEVTGPNPNGTGAGGSPSRAWSSQNGVDVKGVNLSFTLVSYTSSDEWLYDYPVFFLDGTFYGLNSNGTLGAPIGAGDEDGAGTINNGNPASNVTFSVDIDALAGPGRHDIGFGVNSVDGVAGAGVATFDNVGPAKGDSDPCDGGLCSDAAADCVECLFDSHCGGGMFCDGGTGQCVACLITEHCDDGDVCNGVEICSGGGCAAGTPLSCGDGLFCTGAETCDAVLGCVSPGSPCGSGAACDEGADTCDRRLQPRAGEPLAGLTSEELDRFYAGQARFDGHIQAPQGLGPVFNQDSCGACHNDPLGGSGSITVTRFGRVDKGAFDPLEALGGSLLQAQAINLGCPETVPPEANVTAQRLTPSTMGFGLVEAIPDADILARELSPPPGVSGRTHVVIPFETPGTPRVGRFGWKAQVATVLTFSADAALNEMGLTNRFITQDNAPNGDVGLLAQCDTVADPEDQADAEGYEFIDRVTDFQRFLSPAPQTPRSGMSGEALFVSTGCAACHVPAHTTGPAAEAAISGKLIKPYGDFLLHDMGLLGDGIVQGDAQASELRTPALWGVRLRDPLLHDGRVAAGTLASRVAAVVGWHDVTGSEASAAASAFLALSSADQAKVVAFLDSLGRAEFDHEGDNDVDLTDFDVMHGCLTDPGAAAYTPDDPCAISDFDQDGDVDLRDIAWMQQAYTGEL